MNRLKLTQAQRRSLEDQLQETLDARVYRRTLALLEYNRGRSVKEIAPSLGVTLRSIYHWIAAYEQSHDPTTLIDALRSGRPRLWSQERQALLRTLLETSPDQWGYLALNWTVPLLQEQIEQATGQRLSEDTIRRELDRQRYVWKRFRYVLSPDPQREKKTLSAPISASFEIGNGDCHRG
jgi:transposase